MGARWRIPGAALLVALSSIAWLDSHARTREANRLFAAGKYDDAASAYNEELVDHPDSSLLHFNLGDTQYKQGKYDDALATFTQVQPSDDDPAAAARAAYNSGNANYRLGEVIASTDPKAALDRYAQALIAYRRAITAAPDDLDAKLNYELVEQKRAELQKKLEEQQQQQKPDGGQQQQKNGEQQQQQQKDSEQQQQQQKDSEQQQQQQKDGEQQQAGADQEPNKQPDASGSPAPQPQQDAAASPRPEQSPAADQQGQPAEAKNDQAGAQPQQQAQAPSDAGGSAAATGEQREGDMTRQEAAALLDAQRSQEVQPGEIVRRLQGAAVAEPATDW